MQQIVEGQMSDQEIDVILTSHNRLDLTIKCVNALYENTPTPFKLTIIDDSTDLTPAYFEQFGGDNINFIHSDEPFKSGNQILNIGLKETKNPYIVNLNNSITVEPDWLPVALHQIGKDKSIGLIGFKLLNPLSNGTISHAGIIVDRRGLMNIGVGEPSHHHTYVAPVPAVGWALVLFRRNAYPKPLDEETYIGFRGWDDIDNCLVIRKAGLKVMYCGFGVAYHLEGATRVTRTQEFWNETGENAKRFFKKWPEVLEGKM